MIIGAHTACIRLHALVALSLHVTFRGAGDDIGKGGNSRSATGPSFGEPGYAAFLGGVPGTGCCRIHTPEASPGGYAQPAGPAAEMVLEKPFAYATPVRRVDACMAEEAAVRLRS
jgi:hypothetical protein